MSSMISLFSWKEGARGGWWETALTDLTRQNPSENDKQTEVIRNLCLTTASLLVVNGCSSFGIFLNERH